MAEPLTLRRALRAAACGGFAVYACWNAAWLLRGEVPPGLLVSLFGIPGPTTGMTRALQALLHGAWLRSLAFNPFLLPTLALLGLSLAGLGKDLVRHRPLRLSRPVALAWLADLCLAWLWTLLAVRLHPGSLWPPP